MSVTVGRIGVDHFLVSGCSFLKLGGSTGILGFGQRAGFLEQTVGVGHQQLRNQFLGFFHDLGVTVLLTDLGSFLEFCDRAVNVFVTVQILAQGNIEFRKDAFALRSDFSTFLSQRTGHLERLFEQGDGFCLVGFNSGSGIVVDFSGFLQILRCDDAHCAKGNHDR